MRIKCLRQKQRTARKSWFCEKKFRAISLFSHIVIFFWRWFCRTRNVL